MTRGPRLPAAARAIVDGDRRALARTISAIEDGDPAVSAVLSALYPRSRDIPVVGLAGPLGVGKSSLVNALVRHLRAVGRTVAVIAVDPSSPYSGGSVLGDRIRLEIRADDPGVFFRSMASRGAAGGLAAATREVARLLGTAGFDVILIETVGSGQVDVAIREVATTGVVVLVPHLGDEVQTMKAGLFEIADVFCVNKSDLPGADVAQRDLAELAALGTPRDGWRPPVLTTSTLAPSGVPELWAAIEAHEKFLDTGGRRAAGERRRLAAEVVARARDLLTADLTGRLERDPALRALLDRVAARALDPRAAARRLAAPGRRRR